jgi:hypothetical protein
MKLKYNFIVLKTGHFTKGGFITSKIAIELIKTEECKSGMSLVTAFDDMRPDAVLQVYTMCGPKF